MEVVLLERERKKKRMDSVSVTIHGHSDGLLDPEMNERCKEQTSISLALVRNDWDLHDQIKIRDTKVQIRTLDNERFRPLH